MIRPTRFNWALYTAFLLPTTLIVLMFIGWQNYQRAVDQQTRETQSVERIRSLFVDFQERVDQAQRPYTTESMTSLLAMMARMSGSTITLLSTSGQVRLAINPQGRIAPPTNGASAEPWLDLPEVTTALRHGVGESRRQSSQSEQSKLYLAYRLDTPSTSVMRVAIPLKVQRSLFIEHSWPWSLALLAVSLALLSATLYQLRITRTIRLLNQRCRHLRKRILTSEQVNVEPLTTAAEFWRLTNALNRLSRKLATKSTTFMADRRSFVALLSGIRDGVLIVDADEKARLWNTRLCQLLHIDPPQEPHPSLTLFCQQQPLIQVVREAMTSRQPMERELTLYTLGHEFNILAEAFPIQAGSSDEVALILRDLTQEQEVQRMRKDFIANASHELKTPLSALKGYIDALQEAAATEATDNTTQLSMDPKTFQNFLNRIHANTDHMIALTRDLLTLAQSEDASQQVERRPINLAATIRQALERFAAAAKRQQVEFSFDPGALGSLQIAGQPTYLAEIFDNLVSNALQAIESGGNLWITIECNEDHSRALISLRDNGSGIPAADLPHLFERFFQVDRSHAKRAERQQSQTGLGLSIVKHLLTMMGGTISVQSQIGVGSTFRIELPILTQS